MSLDGIQLVYFSIFCGELLKFKENSVEFLKVYLGCQIHVTINVSLV